MSKNKTIHTATKVLSSGNTHSSQYYYDDIGAARWVTNDAVIALDIVRDYHIPVSQNVQEYAYANYVKSTLDSIRAYREQNPPSEEEMAELRYELRAAFGPDEEVVDLVTGKKFRT